MEANSKIIDELKASVTSKLKELDPDNTNLGGSLIDYIIVMVINQKNKYEMKHNLALFLGKISDDFVNWLFEHLSRLKQQQQQQLTNDDSGVDIRKKIKNHQKKEDKLKKTVEHQQQQKDNHKKKETISNKRKITAKSTTTEESSSSSKQQRLPKKKLKSAVQNADNLEKPLASKNVLEKCPSTIAKANDDKIDQVLNEKSIESNADVVVKNPTTTIMTTTKTTASIENKIQTKFFVTLDGVKNMFKVANDDVDDDDLFLMDEELDPELMNEDFSNISDQFVMNNKKEKYKDLGSMMMNNNNNKFERCRYWPSCMNGNKCDYYHPIIKCNMFPHCRFGDKCLYIHPICKYDSVCSRKDCPFFHTYVANMKRNQLINPTVVNVICKYFPKCANPNCEFIHPKIICHYGSTCKTFNCPYVHPNNPNQIPHPSQLKWSSEMGGIGGGGGHDNLIIKQKQRKQPIEI
ncbi:hypothetical protein DERP_002605 [Dermatophagoides pteronyssinus]|uniref:Zinc finger CCCH domain-containing protein 14 n=1 Tax=Dermatophagoides pteronyssinus TaxID=6956 RepID=A0ABQ8JI84_DERPT|nr:hypothetical protein DERP_002605 [Dermatophagoides pteronyssinus]